VKLEKQERHRLKAALRKTGMKSTRQRELIYGILIDQRNHPTAEEIHAQAKKESSGISLATVYNGLDALVSCGLIKQVHFERSSTRFCPNLKEHAHFQCEQTGEVFDVPLEMDAFRYLQDILPEGFSAHSISLSYVGESPTQNSPAQQGRDIIPHYQKS
jgi:Fur family transcriptional regulator, peroxide stress response regulator